MSENNPARVAMLQLILAAIIIFGSFIISFNRKSKLQANPQVKFQETSGNILEKKENSSGGTKTELVEVSAPVLYTETILPPDHLSN